jgi:lysophospholipase L1-like esterase
MRPRLVLFGDSITEQSFASGGWGAALTDRFARQVRAVRAPPWPGPGSGTIERGRGLDVANSDLAVSGLFGQADVVLRGLSGYNTRWALKVLPRAMEGAAGAGADPAAVTVFFGANDATLPDQVQAHQHVPLQEYQSNLRAISAYFKVIYIYKLWPMLHAILGFGYAGFLTHLSVVWLFDHRSDGPPLLSYSSLPHRSMNQRESGKQIDPL